MDITKRVIAEFLGTFWLVFGGCGSAVFSAKFRVETTSPVLDLGIGLLGVSLAFGLTVLTMAYAVGHISGGHFNPAISLGLWIGKRFPAKDLPWYIVAQVLGAIAAGGLIFIIATGNPNGVTNVAPNGYGELSPGKYSLMSGMIAEIVLTFMFVIVVMGATDSRAPKGFAPVAIGLALTLIHLISIPITNTSVNPARSTGAALFSGTQYIAQLWLFWVAPIAGALIAGWLYNFFYPQPPERSERGEPQAARPARPARR
jgi:aquaporin Z